MSTLSPDVDPAVASMPEYRAHQLCAPASHHILVLAAPPTPDDLRFLSVLHNDADDRHTVIRASGADAEGQKATAQALRQTLSRAEAGTHLYLSGTEAQLWPLYEIARQAGVQPLEISLHRYPDRLRPVYCTHCSTVQPADTHPSVICCACGLRLSVRDHFSTRLGAYLAVVADADDLYGKA